MRLELVLPIRTVPGLNAREHWGARAKRVKREREAAHLLTKLPAARLRRYGRELDTRWPAIYPLTITLTRTKPRGPPADDDNLQGACKAVRDGISDALMIDDGNTRLIDWKYAQEKGPWGVKVTISTADEPLPMEQKEGTKC